MQGFDNNGIVDFLTIEGTSNLVEKVVEQVTKAVTSTMGPNGKVAVISTGTKPKVTKDGVTVARAIKFNDPRMELINKVVTEAPIKTDEECGDGTTTTTLLLGELFKIYREFDSYQQQNFIDRLVALWIEQLKANTIYVDVEDCRLLDLARISSNNDIELCTLVVELYREHKGYFPTIDLVQGVEAVDKVIRSNGLTTGAVYSNHLYGGGNTQVTYNDYVPIVMDFPIRPGDVDAESFMRALANLGKQWSITAKDLGKSITIILVARAVETVFDNHILALNKAMAQQGLDVKFVACRMNGAGGSVGTHLLQDLGIMLDAPMINTMEQLNSVEVGLRSDPFTIGTVRSVFSPGELAQERINKRVEELQETLGEYTGKDRFNMRARFDEKRIRNMTGKLVTIWVGGETESDVIERKDRFEDVVKAVKSALVNGIVPGVGTTLIKAMAEVAVIIHKENPDTLPTHWKEILGGLLEVSHKQNEILMEGVINDDNPENEVIDLATGRRGKPEHLGIYDTAYAAITALRGGAQNAKILANMRSIMVSDKLNALSLGN